MLNAEGAGPARARPKAHPHASPPAGPAPTIPADERNPMTPPAVPTSPASANAAAPTDRRVFLRDTSALLAAASGLMALAVLPACSSGKKTAARSRVGEPLPADPVLKPIAAAPKAKPKPGAAIPTGIIPRSAWTSEAPVLSLADPMQPVRRITVHHDAIGVFTSTDQSAAAARMESIRRSHRQRGFADIGYHYAIDPAGRVWQGRPTNLQGAHVKDQNPGNLGILVMGNFELQNPSPQQRAALQKFVNQQMSTYRLSAGNVVTHQELAPTACPGRSLQAYMNDLRGRGALVASA